MSEMAWRYLYSTEGKGTTYKCTKCGYRITAKFGEKKLPPCPICRKHEVKCENCKWFKGYADRYGDGHCTRFPMWVETVFDHYCGEWKDNNDD